MTEELKQGAQVEWSVGSGKTVGTVQEKVTRSTKVDGQKVDASEDAPRYLVKNNSTGQMTGHKPETLRVLEDKAQADNLYPGDQVKWKTAQGETVGTVKEKLTEPTSIKDYDVKASEDNPKYLVESDKAVAQAAHKPDALDKV